MRRVRRATTKVLVTGMLCLLVAPFLGSTAIAQGTDGPDLRVRLHYGTPGGIFDPALWRYTSDWFVYPSLFNWLFRWVPGSGGSQLEPDLAESWEMSEDGRVYTFHLREGVQFQDGYGEMTASDVVFSFQRQMDDESMSFNQDLSNVASVTAVDDYTVEIALHEPQPSFLAMVVAYRPGFIISQAAVEERGADFAIHPIGTGPYVMRGINELGEVVTEAHPDFFRGTPDARSITFVHVGEEAVVAAAIANGELQFIQTRGNPEVVQALSANPDIHVERRIQYDNILQVQFSPNFEPVQDVLVRRAMAHAIDR